MRRSLAIGGSLTRADTERLLDACQTLLNSGRRSPLSSVNSARRGAKRERHSTSRRGSCARRETARAVGTPPIPTIRRRSCRGGVCHKNVLNSERLLICATLSGWVEPMPLDAWGSAASCRRHRFPTLYADRACSITRRLWFAAR